MNLYIHGTGLLSGAGSNNNENFLQAASEERAEALFCKEPDYAGFIPPMQLRRMSKAVRMGIGATRICLQDAGAERADAISLGTAFGCLQDTEVFLDKMVSQKEQMLTPTAFIQSTHNTVAGQIALVTGCHGHNLTFVHRGHSFEHAMINARLYLDDHPGEQILTGAIEELTPSSLRVLKQIGAYRNAPISPASVLREAGPGSLAGEGAAFFLVSRRPSAEGSLRVKEIATFIDRDNASATGRVEQFMDKHGLKETRPDFVLLGVSGDERNELFYRRLQESTFSGCSQAAFKHLCGEYPVAGSFALGLLAHAVRNGLPETAVLNHAPKALKRILLVNNFLHHYSCWYLEVV